MVCLLFSPHISYHLHIKDLFKFQISHDKIFVGLDLYKEFFIENAIKY